MQASEFVQFANDACTVISSCQQVIHAQAEELEALRKNANAGASEATPVAFSDELLKKASEAVHAMYGKPANVKPETIANYWKSKPEAALATICKMASERINSAIIEGSDLGKQIKKKASATAERLSADDAFWANQR